MKELTKFFHKLHITPEKAAVRLLSVFAIVSATAVLGSDIAYTEPEFLLTVRPLSFFLRMLGGFLFLCAVLFPCRTVKADKTILFLCVSFYFLIILFKSNNVWQLLLIAVLALMLCVYCLHGTPLFSLRINKYVAGGLVTALALLFTVYVGGLTALRYKMYIAPNFDFGIFAQMFDYMKETGVPYATCERDMLLSHLDVHLSFIYYLLLPIYWLFSTPYTLNIMQAVILASGVLPLYLLCRHQKLSETVSVLLCTVYVFYPALSAGCFYDIHENCFLAPLLLWLMLSIEKDSTVGLFLSALLVCSVKEDAPVYLMFIALYMVFAKRKFIKPALLLGLAVAWFLAAVWYLDHHGDGAMLYRYSNFSTSGGSIKDIIKACILNPGYVFSQCFDSEKVSYALKILLPLGFLPLITTKMYRYILVGPFMLINLMSYYPYQHSLDFQYNFGTTALLIYLAVVNLAELKENRRRIVALWCAVISVCGASAFVGGRLDYISYYNDTKKVVEQIDRVLETAVPEDASVYCCTFLLPHLYRNDILYQLNADSPDVSGRTEYVVLDMRYAEFSALYQVYVDAGFEVVAMEPGAAAVLRCPFYKEPQPGQTAENVGNG